MVSQLLPVERDQLFHCLFEQASLGIAIEDLDGQVLLANPALCSMLGYSKSELCGMHCSQFASAEDSADDYALFQELRAGIIDHYSLEKRYARKDGTRLWGRLRVSLLNHGDRQFPLVFAFVEDITETKLTEDRLASATGRLIEAQEQERARIARELHDDTNQRLAMLALGIEQLKAELQRGELRCAVDNLQKSVCEISEDIQALAHELHSPRLELMGLVAAMRGFCREFEEQRRVQIDFKVHNLPSPLSPDVSLCLFRVLQEALHNSAKHSGMRHFDVRLSGTSNEIHLTVKDSGAGFDREAARQSRGLGLISMEERLKFLRGTLSINSRPERGTIVHATVPLRVGSQSTRAAG